MHCHYIEKGEKRQEEMDKGKKDYIKVKQTYLEHMDNFVQAHRGLGVYRTSSSGREQ